MKNIFKIFLIVLPMVFSACNCDQNKAEISKIESAFPKGEILNSDNFSGTVWLKMLGAEDSTLHARYGNVTFEPEARTNWHSHPGGQLLIITQGKGYYQAKGKMARLLQAGDFVEIPSNVVHWHGAAPESEFAHIAISLNTDEGGTEWLKPVSDEEYTKATN